MIVIAFPSLSWWTETLWRGAARWITASCLSIYAGWYATSSGSRESFTGHLQKNWASSEFRKRKKKFLNSGRGSTLSDRSPDRLLPLHWTAVNSTQPTAHPDAWIVWMSPLPLHCAMRLIPFIRVIRGLGVGQWRGSAVWHGRAAVTIQLAASIFAPPPHDLHQSFLLTVNLCKVMASLLACAANASNALIGWKDLG